MLNSVGVSYATLGIKQDENGVRKLAYCSKNKAVIIDHSVMDIIFRSTVDINRVNTYEYSIDDGETFLTLGGNYTLRPGGYRGDLIGMYTFNNEATGKLLEDCKPDKNYKFGYVDINYFKYDYLR